MKSSSDHSHNPLFRATNAQTMIPMSIQNELLVRPSSGTLLGHEHIHFFLLTIFASSLATTKPVLKSANLTTFCPQSLRNNSQTTPKINRLTLLLIHRQIHQHMQREINRVRSWGFLKKHFGS
jgi:hypothetical protein